MSCTSVIFLLRLELSQGFNWNPDFKEALAPRYTRPSSAFLQPASTPSTARSRMDAGMDVFCAYRGYKSTALPFLSRCFFGTEIEMESEMEQII